MKFRSLIFSAIVIVVFFILATATSQDQDFGPEVTLDLEASLFESNLVLQNKDTLDVVNASLFLFHPADSVSGSLTAYSIGSYELNIGAVDTIPFSSFKLGGKTFPVDSMPSLLTVEMISPTITGFFQQAF